MKPTVTKINQRNIYGRRRAPIYEARIGSVDAEAPTAKLATEICLRRLERMANLVNARHVIHGYTDPTEVWLLHPMPSGWQYEIRSPGRSYPFSCDFGDEETTFLDAVRQMEKHWWDASGMRSVVEGIVGLCTDVRQFSCHHCTYPTTSSAPYRCVNPACGHLVAQQEHSKYMGTRPRLGMRLVPCPGDAHSNPYIDNCGLCAPRWGWLEIPEQYETLEAYDKAREAAGARRFAAEHLSHVVVK